MKDEKAIEKQEKENLAEEGDGQLQAKCTMYKGGLKENKRKDMVEEKRYGRGEKIW